MDEDQAMLEENIKKQQELLLDESMDPEKKKQLRLILDSEKRNLEMLMDAKKQLELMKKDTKPFINYTPPNYYRPQLEYETDEQYKQRQDSYKEYNELTKYFRDIDGYTGDKEEIRKAIDKYREHIVNMPE